MKKCPYCAEEIQDEAIKCRFCGSMLDEDSRFPGATPHADDAEVRQLLSAGKKIEAIKLVREKTHIGLKEAKDYVEALERGVAVRMPSPIQRSAEPETSSPVAAIVIALVVLAAGLAWMSGWF